jgi:hypothetical protein
VAPAASTFEERLRGLRRAQIRRILGQSWRGIPGSSRHLSLLRGSLTTGTPEARRCLLSSPLLGGWLQDVLFWREALGRASRLLARSAPKSDSERLFSQMARTEYLSETVPSGRVDALFPRRVRRRATSVLRARLEDLPRILWPHLRPPGKGGLRLLTGENLDEGCPAGRVRLGMTQAMLVRKGRKRAEPLQCRFDTSGLVIPAGADLHRHETIPGTSILLSHRLVSRGGSLSVGTRVPGLAERAADALSLVERAWPEAGAEIRRRTWLLVPLVEPGTVSYSHLARPGISYINVFRGTLLDLADDLLHETAHHRLHAWQEVEAFTRDDGEQGYFSPWRRGLRPLNGILHGTYTFLDRSELLIRAALELPAFSRARRRALRSEARRELARCDRCLLELSAARREGLLTPSGSSLLTCMQRHRGSLKSGRLSEAVHFSIF